MFEKILVAYDGSGQSERALEAAVDLAKCSQRTLCLVSVIEKLPHYAEETMNGVDEAVENLQKRYETLQERAAAKAERAGIVVTSRVVPGHPVEEIIHVADQEKVDLIVLGGMGHTRMFHRSSGGTGSQIAYHAPCSVLLVR